MLFFCAVVSFLSRKTEDKLCYTPQYSADEIVSDVLILSAAYSMLFTFSSFCALSDKQYWMKHQSLTALRGEQVVFCFHKFFAKVYTWASFCNTETGSLWDSPVSLRDFCNSLLSSMGDNWRLMSLLTRHKKIIIKAHHNIFVIDKSHKVMDTKNKKIMPGIARCLFC